MIRNLKNINFHFKHFRMKHLFTAALIFLSIQLFAQDASNDSKFKLNWGGFVWYEAFYDTYQSVDTRDGNLLLYPNRPKLDPDGKDLNEVGQFEMVSIQTRLKLNISGPDAFGAKTSGLIETDFEGTSQAIVRTLRLRHAFINLKWEKANLRLGQYWHPLFLTENFPLVLSFGAALPIQPFSRAPQARFNYKTGPTDFMLAALIHGYNRTPGEYDAQRNAGLPEMLFQFKYNSGVLFAGATVGYKVLKPRTETELGYKTDQTLGAYTTQAFLKITTQPIIFKLQGVYGQNLSSYTMIGGYGAKEGTTDALGNFEYTNMETLAAWAEIMSNNPKFNYGFFAGYTENLGFSDNLDQIFLEGRALEMASLLRVSPRVSLTSGPVMIGFEYMYNLAEYGTDFDETMKATASESSENHRFLVAVKYTFK